MGSRTLPDDSVSCCSTFLSNKVAPILALPFTYIVSSWPSYVVTSVFYLLILSMAASATIELAPRHGIPRMSLPSSPNPSVDEIHYYAWPAISSLTSKIVGERIHQEVGKLSKDPRSQIRARTNGRGWDLKVGSWNDVRSDSLEPIHYSGEARPLNRRSHYRETSNCLV
jgi:hypothetical protein